MTRTSRLPEGILWPFPLKWLWVAHWQDLRRRTGGSSSGGQHGSVTLMPSLSWDGGGRKEANLLMKQAVAKSLSHTHTHIFFSLPCTLFLSRSHAHAQCTCIPAWRHSHWVTFPPHPPSTCYKMIACFINALCCWADMETVLMINLKGKAIVPLGLPGNQSCTAFSLFLLV